MAFVNRASFLNPENIYLIDVLIAKRGNLNVANHFVGFATVGEGSFRDGETDDGTGDFYYDCGWLCY